MLIAFYQANVKQKSSNPTHIITILRVHLKTWNFVACKAIRKKFKHSFNVRSLSQNLTVNCSSVLDQILFHIYFVEALYYCCCCSYCYCYHLVLCLLFCALIYWYYVTGLNKSWSTDSVRLRVQNLVVIFLFVLPLQKVLRATSTVYTTYCTTHTAIAFFPSF